MWSLTLSIGTSLRIDLIAQEAVDIFIYPYILKYKCFLSLGAAT
jgi:hypothetical protein